MSVGGGNSLNQGQGPTYHPVQPNTPLSPAGGMGGQVQGGNTPYGPLTPPNGPLTPVGSVPNTGPLQHPNSPLTPVGGTPNNYMPPYQYNWNFLQNALGGMNRSYGIGGK